MKNPFEKEDHTGLIVGIAVGVTAGIGLVIPDRQRRAIPPADQPRI